VNFSSFVRRTDVRRTSDSGKRHGLISISRAASTVHLTKNSQPHQGCREPIRRRLFGGAGNDTLTGGAGDDIREGGIGVDNLDGGPGNNILVE
jgi:hypothetical protein